MIRRRCVQVMIGYFSVFRGFVNVTGGATAKRTSGEWNEVTSTNERSLEILHAELTLLSGGLLMQVYLGFSRDGYHWHRPEPRQAFMKQAWPVHGKPATIDISANDLV